MRHDFVNVTALGVHAAPEGFHHLAFDPLLLLRGIVVSVVDDEAGFHLALAAKAFELRHLRACQSRL